MPQANCVRARALFFVFDDKYFFILIFILFKACNVCLCVQDSKISCHVTYALEASSSSNKKLRVTQQKCFWCDMGTGQRSELSVCEMRQKERRKKKRILTWKWILVFVKKKEKIISLSWSCTRSDNNAVLFGFFSLWFFSRILHDLWLTEKGCRERLHREKCNKI